MISVIVPCYKCTSTLERCVESIEAQIYKEIEILLIDDGSPDDTGEVCDRLAKSDSRIKVIHQQNRGLVGAWKRGLLEAGGEYICFVDSDDWIEPDALDKMLKKSEQYSVDMVVCGISLDYSNGKSLYHDNRVTEGFYDRQRIEKEIFPIFFHIDSMRSRAIIVSRCSKLIKREVLMKNYDQYRENISFGEDDFTIFTTILCCDSIYCFRGYFPYHYCRNNQSMIGSFDPQAFSKCLELNASMKEIAELKEYPYIEMIQIHFIENVFLILKKNMHRNSQDSLFEIARYTKSIVETEDVQSALRACARIRKQYCFKEKIFVELLDHRFYLLCVFVVKILAKLNLGKE